MANLNKVMLIGRLTRDPEVRTFTAGGKVANFGFAVNNRKKNQATGQWDDEPVFLDLEAFNRGDTGRQLADVVEQYFRKGRQFFIEGHLRLDQWTDKDGQKRSRLKIVMDNFQFLEPRTDTAGGEGPSYPRGSSGNRFGTTGAMNQFEEPAPEPSGFGAAEGQPDSDIPF